MPNIYDVARAAGLSIGTVSRYVNSSGYVAKESARRIQIAIDELGYVSNAAARSLTTKKTRLIGLIVSDLSNPFTSDLAKAVQVGAYEAGYSAVVQGTDDNEDRAVLGIAALRGHQVEGLVAAIPETPRVVEALGAAVAGGIPVVVIGMHIEPVPADRISTDTYSGGLLAMGHLLGLGHRRVGYVGAPGQASGRRRAYEDSLTRAGIPIDPRLIVETELTRAGGVDGAESLLSSTEPPTAVFAANDTVALGVYEAAYRRTLRIPDDLSVIGFDDIDIARLAVPALTTVAQPREEMGLEAVRLLESRLEGASPTAFRQNIFTCHLVVRGSTAALPAPALSTS